MWASLASPFTSQKSHHSDRSGATDAVHLFEIPAGDSVCFSQSVLVREREFNKKNEIKKDKGLFEREHLSQSLM